MRRDLTFRQFLAEDEGEDIVSGLRKLVSDIRTNWKSPYSAVRGEQEKLWKKLPEQAQKALRAQFSNIIASAMADVARPLKLSSFNPSSKLEASFIVLTFRRLTKDLQDQIGPNFLEAVASGPEPVIDDVKVEELKAQYNPSQLPMDRPLGKTTLDFVIKHQNELTRFIGVEDDRSMGFDIYTVQQNLAKAIRATPKERQLEAVIGVHYLLLRMSRQFAEAALLLERQYGSKALPAEPPSSKPDGGITK